MYRRRVVAKETTGGEISLYSDPNGNCDIEAIVDIEGREEDIELIIDKENQIKLGKALLYHAEHGSLEGLE